MVGESLSNPDVVIRTRGGVTLLGPMTRAGEDWLAALTGQVRPQKDLGNGEFSGCRSFVVTPAGAGEAVEAAEKAGIVVRDLRGRDS